MGSQSMPAVSTDEGKRLLQEYVSRVLVNKSNGTDVAGYQGLVKEFSGLRKKVTRDPTDSGCALLANFVNALRDCVSVLRERHHDAILTEVLGIKLWGIPQELRLAVLDLVTTLVMVNTAYTHTCLRLLVSSLAPPPTAPPDPSTLTGAWQASEEDTVVQADITAALIKVLERVPTAPAALMQLVSTHMPHKLRDRNAQCAYLSAVFTLAEAPAGRPVRDAVLSMVVEHLLALDVEIKWEDIVDVPNDEAVEEGGNEVDEVEEIFQLDGMSGLDINATPEQLEAARQERLAQLAGQRGGWEGASAGAHDLGVGAAAAAGEAGPGAVEVSPVDEAANKLDSLMELAFAHLERRCTLPGAGGPAAAWAALLASFERTVLNTHRSKFSQFLVFFLAHKYPDPCARLFTEFLLTRLHDTRLPGITRSACAAYLASFLARSCAVSPTLVLHALDALTRFCEQYCGALGEAGNIASSTSDLANLTARHSVLYAAVQAVLYVLCYHLESLLSHQHTHHHKTTVPEATRVLITARILPLVAHPLQPLGVCLPSVVAEFRSQLAAHGLAHLPPTPALGDRPGGQRPLEMFFPFDPYLLKRSSRFLQLPESYRKWRRGHAEGGGTAGAAAVSESDAEADSSDGEEVDAVAGVAGVLGRPAVAGQEDEDGDLDLSDSDSDSDTDSSESEEGGSSLRGGSVTSQGMMHGSIPGSLTHPHAHHHHHPKPPLGRAGRGGQAWTRLDGGAGPKAVRTGSPTMLMGTSYGDAMMATSYGNGMPSSFGDLTPTGTSPVLVDYKPGGAGLQAGMAGVAGPGLGQGVSPMDMTPQFHTMDAVPARLAAAAASQWR